MKSIRDIYKIGHGPSSSHTLAIGKGCDYIINNFKIINDIKVILYGSLALTGKGHLTDVIIKNKFNEINKDVDISFNLTKIQEHPNTIEFIFKDEFNNIKNIKMYSLGGGDISLSLKKDKEKELYKENNLKDILLICKNNNLSLFEYILNHEDKDILVYLNEVYKIMEEATIRGLNNVSILPGELKLSRKAREIYLKSQNEIYHDKLELLVMASSFAVSEENASGGKVVTAPTCGSSGVIPGVITYLKNKGINKDKIIEGLAVAGLIGNLIKENASLSGAIGGCQAEIGSACAMGASLIMHCFNFNNDKIAQASEIALEHSLGLTCDPIKGYVQIPCIERNAIFALKAINSASLASIISKSNSKIEFDDIVKTMYETGNDLHLGYKETSLKGMSKIKL